MDILKNIEKAILPPSVNKHENNIGVIGTGFIVRECHLKSYEIEGLNVYAIAARDYIKTSEVANRYKIKNIYKNYKELIDDENIDILDIAVPPDVQSEIVRYACSKKHIKGILCQKPLSVSYKESKELALIARESNIKMAVNSNCRYDLSFRSLKYCLDEGYLGEPIVMNFELHAIPHWQEFAKGYDKLTFLNFSIHTLDIFRFLFGSPKYITAHCIKDRRLSFDHFDGITQYTYTYEKDFIATAIDDTYAYPESESFKDSSIDYRLTASEGVAKGAIGWHDFPKLTPSTFALYAKINDYKKTEPKFEKCWFPHAFYSTMADLLYSVQNKTEPSISANDHLESIACVEACYISAKEKRSVSIDEIINA